MGGATRAGHMVWGMRCPATHRLVGSGAGLAWSRLSPHSLTQYVPQPRLAARFPQLWDSGFISVPYNFKINELPNKIKLLQAGQRITDSSSSNGNGAPSAPSLVARAATARPHASSGAASSGPAPCGHSALHGCGSGARQGLMAAICLRPLAARRVSSAAVRAVAVVSKAGSSGAASGLVQRALI